MNTPTNPLDEAVLAAIKSLWPMVRSKLDRKTETLIDNILNGKVKTLLTKSPKK
jgi:hypothetical protein